MGKRTYIADGTIFDGKREYAPGDEIELTAEQADQLLGVKMIKPDTLKKTSTQTHNDRPDGDDTPSGSSSNGDDIDALFANALFAGVIESGKGGWYRFGQTNMARGKANALEALRSDPELVARIRETLASIKPKNNP